MVTKASATLGAGEMDALRLDADHRGLNKFPARNSNYRLVSQELIKMLQNGRGVRVKDEVTPQDIRRKP